MLSVPRPLRGHLVHHAGVLEGADQGRAEGRDVMHGLDAPLGGELQQPPRPFYVGREKVAVGLQPRDLRGPVKDDVHLVAEGGILSRRHPQPRGAHIPRGLPERG